MQIEEPRSYKTATGSPIVTEEGLHRCMNFRVAPVHKALVSASKVCRKGYRIILGSSLDVVACFTNARTNGSGCAKIKVSTFSMVGFFRQ